MVHQRSERVSAHELVHFERTSSRSANWFFNGVGNFDYASEKGEGNFDDLAVFAGGFSVRCKRGGD